MKKILFKGILLIAILIIGTTTAGATLKVGILPDADSIPLIVAREEGLFADSGFNIQIVTFHSPVERDSAIQAGAIDGAISDVLAVALARDNGLDLTITSLTTGRYVLLANQDSAITSYQDLKGVEIAISSNTIIEYVTDRLLKRKGFSDQEITKIAIPKIPIRLQMLQEGKVKAACLPEPLASVLLLNGANKIGSSSELGEAPGIMLFTDKAIKNKGSEIEAFYQAYSQAVQLINHDADRYRKLLITKGGFPKEIQNTFVFPEYDLPKLPAEETVQLVLDWLREKELIKKDFSYNELVTTEFIE